MLAGRGEVLRVDVWRTVGTFCFERLYFESYVCVVRLALYFEFGDGASQACQLSSLLQLVCGQTLIVGAAICL